MSIDEIVRLIDDIDTGDPEAAHSRVDKILMELAPSEVRDAIERLQGRCRWWAAA